MSPTCFITFNNMAYIECQNCGITWNNSTVSRCPCCPVKRKRKRRKKNKKQEAKKRADRELSKEIRSFVSVENKEKRKTSSGYKYKNKTGKFS